MGNEGEEQAGSVEHLVPDDRLDEWLDAVFSSLRASRGVTGYEIQRSDDSGKLFDVTARGVEAFTVLHVEVRKGGPAKVRVNSDLDGGTRELCENAVAAAQRMLDEEPKEFSWSAVIGHDPDVASYTAERVGEDPVVVGGITLTSGPEKVFEYVTDTSAYGERKLAVMWPVHVADQVLATSGRQAARIAALKARQLCALLSLISHDYWIVRIGPAVSEAPKEPWFPATDQSLVEPGVVDDNYGEPRVLSFPEWIGDSFTVLDCDRKIGDALIAYHEALLLQERHPSMALVAFMTAIEAIGSRTVALTRCQTCEHCTEEFGYARRFRRTLSRVLHRKEISYLGDVYNYRSRTAHDGTLFGNDRFSGMTNFAHLLASDKERDFRSLLSVLRRACRRLLVLELGGPEDWVRSADALPQGLVAAVVGMGAPPAPPQSESEDDAPGDDPEPSV